ncbi:MAG: hypothetical protein IKU86_10085 [Thermoguttaceae bacterium]|nr:hypothetical protein [Thermoguttaceae bacterium]
MESKKRFERWNRCEIKLNERKGERDPRREEEKEESQDKKRDLRRMGKVAPEKCSRDKDESPERSPYSERESAVSADGSLGANETSKRKRFLKTEAPSLWGRGGDSKADSETRRQKRAVKSILAEKPSTLESVFPRPKRRRTFRGIEPPRRSDRRRRDWEQGDQDREI